MSFMYRPSKDDGGGQHWATYSDLFAALSVVFLLLYVVASLRTGTFGVQQYQDYQRLAQEAEDLRQQIRVYNTLKDDYLSKSASQDELEAYEELMSKLNLLQEETRQEQEALKAQAQEVQQKEVALNQYQQMIRNIINSNYIAKGRIQRRDRVIQEKDEVIVQKEESLENQLTTIRLLERQSQDKQSQIEAGQKEIEQVRSALANREQELTRALHNQQLTQKAYDEQLKSLRAESQEAITELQARQEQNKAELNTMASRLAKASTDLARAQETISSQQEEKETLVASLQSAQQEAQDRITELTTQHQVQNRLLQKRFEDELKKEQLTGQQKLAREKQHQEQLKQRQQQLQAQVGQLQQGIQATKAELDKAREQLEARKQLTNQIAQNLKKAGVDVQVDGKTGDVILTFGDQYFDTGRADLKPRMISKLEKFVPVYSQSLFQNAEISNKIGSVEIIGFASPTYQGRYVDPSSLHTKDREAVNYNLDLSYNRAKSIFNHIFDTSKMSYKNQKDLLPLVKVTGRSYLADGVKGRNIASGLSVQEYCKQYDCEQSQKVIIKFNLKE